jgi:hypothetical protein
LGSGGIVRERGGVVGGVDDRRAVAVLIVAVGGHILLSVSDGGDQAYGVVRQLGDVAKGVGDLRQLACGGTKKSPLDVPILPLVGACQFELVCFSMMGSISKRSAIRVKIRSLSSVRA